jgi:ABC-2 type transport system permease protein
MPWAVFRNALRDSLGITLIWGVGMVALMLLMVSMVPFLEGLELSNVFASLPPQFLAALGFDGGEESLELLGTPEGLLAYGFFGEMLLIFAAYPVVMGLRATSNEEANGTLDVVLSLPLSRTRLLLERFLAYALDIILLPLMMIGGLYLGLVIFPVELDAARLTTLILNLLPTLWFILAATVFVGALISDRRKAITIMTIFVVGSYIVQAVGGMVTTNWVNIVESLSFFTYYDVERLLSQSIIVRDTALLVTLTLVLIGSSVVVFRRRDIAV